MNKEYPTQWLDIDKPCTVRMLLSALSEMEKEHGDLQVIVTGCYESSGDVLDIGYKKYDDGDIILLYSDICSG